MDRGAWRATVHRVAKGWTRLKRFSRQARKERREGLGGEGVTCALLWQGGDHGWCRGWSRVRQPVRLEGWLPGPCHTLGTLAVFPEFSLVVCFLQPIVSLSASKELASGNPSTLGLQVQA